MTVAIFSDIHGNYEALKVILEDIKKNNIDKIICLGDTIGIGPKPNECIKLLIENNVIMTLGNHELYYLYGADIDDEMTHHEVMHHNWVKSVLDSNSFKYINGCKLKYECNNIMFEHFPLLNNPPDDYPFEDLEKAHNGTLKYVLKSLNCKILFIGHEHNAFIDNLDDKRIVDVGSSGCVLDNITHYTIIDTDTLNIKTVRLTYNRNNLIEDIKNREYPCREYLAFEFFDVNI